MRQALELARKAKASDEVPVDAVIVKDDELVAEGFNQPIGTHDDAAHVEVVALRAAGERVWLITDYPTPRCMSLWSPVRCVSV